MQSINQLEVVVKQFNEWRSTRGKARLTPPNLIHSALGLIGAYPRNEIVKALGINSSMLSRWQVEQSKISDTPQFVELPRAVDTPKSPDGIQLEMTVKGSSLIVSGKASELASFVTQLAEG